MFLRAFLYLAGIFNVYNMSHTPWSLWFKVPLCILANVSLGMDIYKDILYHKKKKLYCGNYYVAHDSLYKQYRPYIRVLDCGFDTGFLFVETNKEQSEKTKCTLSLSKSCPWRKRCGPYNDCITLDRLKESYKPINILVGAIRVGIPTMEDK